nr:FixH family protein [Motilimonas sp. E26]
MVKNKWYQQAPVWLIILLPLSAVIAGISTVIIAHNNKVDLVAEDHVKTGKAIHADLSKSEQAVKLGISLDLTLDGTSGLISFNGGQYQPGQVLKLSFYHATLAENDFNLMLSADASGVYRFDLDQAIDGKWATRIEPFDGSWRVQEDIEFPTGKVTLDGKQ